MATRPELHTAVAGQKSKASDYNDNFGLLMTFVEDSITEANAYVDSYMPSQTGNGGKFLTTNGTEASWVNVGGSFPYSGYIEGLQISKSTSTTISVSAGSCYDNTRLKVITLGSDTTKQNTSQGANLTYYVYVISNGSTTDILITTSASSPTLPSGYLYYRQIGYYTTNSSNAIATISYYGLSSSEDKNFANMTNSIMPDYSSGINVSSSPYTAPSNGYFIAERNLGTVSVNGHYAAFSGQAYSSYSILVVVSKGESITWTGSVYKAVFYPVKGVN